jgi:hypothetical protein
MRQLLAVAAIAGGFWSAVVAQAPSDMSPQQLYERHRWFELRDAIAGNAVPPLYSGAVASAFNRTADAERLLNRAVREASTIEVANEAREALGNLYMRLGRSSDMLRVFDELLAVAPSRSDVRNVLRAFESFRRLPNQSARVGRERPFRCSVSANGVRLGHLGS